MTGTTTINRSLTRCMSLVLAAPGDRIPRRQLHLFRSIWCGLVDVTLRVALGDVHVHIARQEAVPSLRIMEGPVAVLMVARVRRAVSDADLLRRGS